MKMPIASTLYDKFIKLTTFLRTVQYCIHNFDDISLLVIFFFIASLRGGQTFSTEGQIFLKILQPRAEHSHYKVGKFIQCVNNLIFILQTIFIFHTRYV